MIVRVSCLVRKLISLALAMVEKAPLTNYKHVENVIDSGLFKCI